MGNLFHILRHLGERAGLTAPIAMLLIGGCAIVPIAADPVAADFDYYDRASHDFLIIDPAPGFHPGHVHRHRSRHRYHGHRARPRDGAHGARGPRHPHTGSRVRGSGRHGVGRGRSADREPVRRPRRRDRPVFDDDRAIRAERIHREVDDINQQP